MKNFVIIRYDKLLEFSKCSNKLVKNGEFVYIKYENGNLFLSTGNNCFFVGYEDKVDGEGGFKIGVNFSKFNSIIGKLYEGSEIKFILKSNRLFIQENNIEAKLMISDYNNNYEFNISSFKILDNTVSKWIVGSMFRCSRSVVDSDRFKGVLFDNEFGCLRAGKFSSGIITIQNIQTEVLRGSRVVVPFEIADVSGRVSSEVSNIILNNKLFGVIFGNGIKIYGSLLHDELPKNYMNMFDLHDTDYMISTDKYQSYLFDKDSFITSVEVAMAVSDSKRSFITMKVIGKDTNSEHIIWEIRCKSSDGSESSEKIRSLEFSGSYDVKFSVSGRDLLNITKSLDENVRIFNLDENPLIISDLNNRGINLLVKAAV